MNPALISYIESQADYTVLTVILNGQTNISRDFMIQTLIETYNLGLTVGTKALTPDEVIPVIPAAAPAEPIGLDQGIIN